MNIPSSQPLNMTSDRTFHPPRHPAKKGPFSDASLQNKQITKQRTLTIDDIINS